MSIKRSLVLLILTLLLVACGSTIREVIVITATPVPSTATPILTITPNPTATNIPSPTPSPEPTIPPISIGDFEAALREHGYSRYPFENDETTGFTWINESVYEQVTTWDFGGFELQVLHDDSSNVRSNHMERKFDVMDDVFPTGFMSELRSEFESYNQRVRNDTSGEPDDVNAYGGEWQEVWAQYYFEETSVQGYQVSFSVWWWQSTCPDKYLYCFYYNFPGLEFTGDSSFKFLTIYIEPMSEGSSGGSA
jgi:hypothetical protein